MGKRFIHIDVKVLVSSMMLVLIISNESLRYGHLLIEEWHRYSIIEGADTDSDNVRQWSPKCDICELFNHLRYHSDRSVSEDSSSDVLGNRLTFVYIETLIPGAEELEKLRGPPFV